MHSLFVILYFVGASTVTSLNATANPTTRLSNLPSTTPSNLPSAIPSNLPSTTPSKSPSTTPSENPSNTFSENPSTTSSESSPTIPTIITTLKITSKSPSTSPSISPSPSTSTSPSTIPSSPTLKKSALSSPEKVVGIYMKLAGIDQLNDAGKEMFEKLTGQHIEWYFNDASRNNTSNLQKTLFDMNATIKVTGMDPPFVTTVVTMDEKDAGS